MLNFLISVISDTYCAITDKRVMYTYIYRNELNVEYLKVKDRFIGMQGIQCMLFVCSKETYQFDDDDSDSDEIKDSISELNQKVDKILEVLSQKVEK